MNLFYLGVNLGKKPLPVLSIFGVYLDCLGEKKDSVLVFLGEKNSLRPLFRGEKKCYEVEGVLFVSSSSLLTGEPKVRSILSMVGE